MLTIVRRCLANSCLIDRGPGLGRDGEGGSKKPPASWLGMTFGAGSSKNKGPRPHVRAPRSMPRRARLADGESVLVNVASDTAAAAIESNRFRPVVSLDGWLRACDGSASLGPLAARAGRSASRKSRREAKTQHPARRTMRPADAPPKPPPDRHNPTAATPRPLFRGHGRRRCGIFFNSRCRRHAGQRRTRAAPAGIIGTAPMRHNPDATR
jgi:hypothetical protein